LFQELKSGVNAGTTAILQLTRLNFSRLPEADAVTDLAARSLARNHNELPPSDHFGFILTIAVSSRVMSDEVAKYKLYNNNNRFRDWKNKDADERRRARNETIVNLRKEKKEESNASQDAYIRGLEKLLFDMDASFKKREASSQALIVRLSIENEQLKEDLSAVEQSSADALQRHMRVKEKCMLLGQNEEKLRKSNADYEARHHEDNDRYDALVERSNSLVAKANEEIEKLEQETTLRIRCLEVENKKTKLELTSTVEKNERLEQEKAELIKLCDDLVNLPSRNPV